MTLTDTQGYQNCCYLIGRVSVLLVARSNNEIVDNKLCPGVQLTMSTRWSLSWSKICLESTVNSCLSCSVVAYE